MSKASTRPPSGMRDFLPLEVVRRRWVIDVIRSVYEAHGFVPLETPAIENLDTLLGKYGDEGDQLLYRVLHRREALARAVESAHAAGRPVAEPELSDQGLRYDLTVPLARVVAQYPQLPRFFARYQIQPVWRADRPGKGRFREFFQCDVDVVGTASPMAEAEVCGAVCSVLDRLGFREFTLRLNHRDLLRSAIASAGIDAASEATALVAVDKLDKIGADGVAEELRGRGIGPASATALLDLLAVDPAADSAARLARLRSRLSDARGRAALEALETLAALLAATPAARRVRIDPALARGLGYYTGPIFEIEDPGARGSLGGGGRYDGLIGMFGKREIPAVGFSLGLERILVLMDERGLYPDLACGPQLLLCWFEVEPGAVLGVAGCLRGQGLRVEVFPEASKLGKQLQYADGAGMQDGFAAILAPDEQLAGELTLKRLSTGHQERVPIDAVAAAIARMRTHDNAGAGG